MEAKVPKVITPLQALNKMRNWCAYQERCHFEVEQKLKSFKLEQEMSDDILMQLMQENYLNEERFVRAFVGGKVRIKKWGKQQIKYALKAKHIEDKLIDRVLKDINPVEYDTALTALLKSKDRLIKEKDPKKKQYKLIQYALSKGYDLDLIKSKLQLIFEED